MVSGPRLAVVKINQGPPIEALTDSGCDCYVLISESLVRRLRLPLVERRAIPLRAFSESAGETDATRVAVFTIEISGYEERLYAYVVPGLEYDLFLGDPWFVRNKVEYAAAQRLLYHRQEGVRIYLRGQQEPPSI